MVYRRRRRSKTAKSMPPRRRYYRRKRKATNRAQVTTVRAASLAPDLLRVKLRYGDTLAFVTSGVNGYTFRLNSLFDPDYSTTGHQPLGFDQYAAFYGRYRVNACKIFINAVSNDTTGPVNVYWHVTNASPSTPTQSALLEQPYVKYCQLSESTGGKTNCFIKSYVNINKVMGYKKGNNDDNTEAVVTADPLNVVYGTIWVATPGGAAPNLNVTVRLVFYCEFMDRKVLAQS